MFSFLHGDEEAHDHNHEHEFVAPDWVAPETPTWAPWGNDAYQDNLPGEEEPVCVEDGEPVCLGEIEPTESEAEELGEEVAEQPELSEEDAAALSEAEGLLTSGFLDPITDGNARDAVTLLEGMTPEAQGLALERMGEEQFNALLTELPTEDRARFEALYQNVGDPERRLRMWAEFHKADAEMRRDAAEEDVGFFDWLNPFSDSEEEYRNGMRDRIVENTETEVDEEVAHLLQRMEDGEDVTAADVDALAERKKMELGMEFQHGFLLTNSLGWEAEGNRPELERRVWSLEELQNVQDALDRLPEDHVTYNHGLQEMQRVQVKQVEKSDGTWDIRRSVGGDAANGRIRVFDLGADPASDTWRTDRDSELAGHDTDGLSLLEEVITHEIGHTIEAGDPELEQRWRDISSWRDWSQDSLREQLINDGMSEDDANQFITDLESGDQEHDGATYRKNHYGGIVSHRTGAVPVGDAGGDTEWSMDDSGEWSYAAETQGEHFAETYAKATHAPEALHEDLVSQPQQAVTDATTARDAAQSNLDALTAAGAPQAVIDQARRTLESAEESLVGAREIASIRQNQWDFMREDVFGLTDETVSGASAELSSAASGLEGGDALVAEFEAASERCATPDQLERLRQEYMERVNALR